MPRDYCRFLRLHLDEVGATAIEYALVAAVVGIMGVVALKSLGGESGGMWDDTGQQIIDAIQAKLP